MGWGLLPCFGCRQAGQTQPDFFPITRRKKLPLAILAPPRCSPSCCPKKPLGSLPELPAFAWLLGVVVVVVVFSLKMGIKAKGFYDCQSSCFSLLFIFNQTVYPSQMICNEFIGFNYCVKKGKKEREKRKNKPYKLEHGL